VYAVCYADLKLYQQYASCVGSNEEKESQATRLVEEEGGERPRSSREKGQGFGEGPRGSQEAYGLLPRSCNSPRIEPCMCAKLTTKFDLEQASKLS
jgi:hypothetical protein